MTCPELRNILIQLKAEFTEKLVQHGTRFTCKTGEILNVFDSGKMSFQGKQDSPIAKEVRAIYEGNGPTSQPEAVTAERRPATPATNKPQIFIVYGHDIAARDQLELILHRMDLEPIILGNLAAAGDTVIEKLEKYLGEHGNVGFACVLLTPDDEGHKAGKPEEKKYRARQNVVLELGWSSQGWAESGWQSYTSRQ